MVFRSLGKLLGFAKAATCPIDQEQQAWVEDSFALFQREFGNDWLRKKPVILPSAQFFPDPYQPHSRSGLMLAARLCGYLDVPEGRLRVHFYDNQNPSSEAMAPGVLYEMAGDEGYVAETEDGPVLVLPLQSLRDSFSLAATIGRNLAVWHLYANRNFDGGDANAALLAELLSIYLGMAVFTANSAYQFTQWHDGQMEGWQMARRSDMSEPMLGFALAVYAVLRDEQDESWTRQIAANIRPYYKQSRRYLAERREHE